MEVYIVQQATIDDYIVLHATLENSRGYPITIEYYIYGN